MALPGEFAITTLFGGAMVLVGGIALLASGRYVWRATAVLRATELDTLDGVAPGALVRVSGATESGEAGVLAAPFSDVDCVALRYSVEERRLSFLYLFPWYVTLHEATGAVPFTVRTGSGSVPVVEPVRTVTLSKAVVETVAAADEPPERVAAFERDHGDVPTSTVWQRPPALVAPLARALSLGTRRYVEQRAAVGADVTVVGRVTGEGASGGSGVDPIVVSDRPAVSTVLRMAKTSIAGVLIGLVGLLLGAMLLGLT